jgi:hypothetical protein
MAFDMLFGILRMQIYILRWYVDAVRFLERLEQEAPPRASFAATLFQVACM